MVNSFFNDNLNTADSELNNFINKEFQRQQNNIELIASENIVSKAVLKAQGSILTNKYAEGYPAKRYYGGCEFVDEIENLAISRAKQLFSANFANVQPHSGSQANMAVMLALLNAGDTILGMDLNSGGHLTHGSAVSFSGKIFNAVSYALNPNTFLLDYDNIKALAKQHKPKLIIAGASSYSQIIDFKKFKEIADEVGAFLLADIAHYAGLVVAGEYPNPINYADIVTTTTHKTLRGPRGGLILSNNANIIKKVNSAIFPGTQGGPLMHVIAAKAVAFKEALQDSFKLYAKQMIANNQAMCNVFMQNNLQVVSGVTKSNLFVIDVSKLGLNGNLVEKALDSVNITCNKNSIPFDTLPPSTTSGIRIGCAAVTTRGFKEQECIQVANLIITVMQALQNNNYILPPNVQQQVQSQVLQLTNQFKIY